MTQEQLKQRGWKREGNRYVLDNTLGYNTGDLFILHHNNNEIEITKEHFNRWITTKPILVTTRCHSIEQFDEICKKYNIEDRRGK